MKEVAKVDQLSTAAKARSMEWVFFFILYNKDVIQTTEGRKNLDNKKCIYSRFFVAMLL